DDSSGAVIFTISGLLKKNPSIAVWVRDGSVGYPENTEGAPADNATVFLYHSKKDYANAVTPAYTAQTNADGKAYFKEIEMGTYFIVVEKEGRSNILREPGYTIMDTERGVYKGYVFHSIFKNQGDIDGSP